MGKLGEIMARPRVLKSKEQKKEVPAVSANTSFGPSVEIRSAHYHAPTRTRASQQSTGLLLSLRDCPFRISLRRKKVAAQKRGDLFWSECRDSNSRPSRRNAALRPTAGLFNKEAPSSQKQGTKKEVPAVSANTSFGPSVEIRTRGLLNPIQARYQTSPHPDIYFG